MKIEKLAGVIPPSRLLQLPSVMEKFKINTPLRLAHFLAQAGHESGSFTATRENLYYSDVKRIALIFRSDVDLNHDRVISTSEIENAKRYVKKPEALANFVYANQNGNGNEASGDGWKYRGGGDIQLTGRGNYAAFDKFVDDDIITNPELVATKYPLLSAAWFFSKNGLNEIADMGGDLKVISLVTRRVNGGTHGLEDRIKRFGIYYALLKEIEVPKKA